MKNSSPEPVSKIGVTPECPSRFNESRRDLVPFRGTGFYRESRMRCLDSRLRRAGMTAILFEGFLRWLLVFLTAMVMLSGVSMFAQSSMKRNMLYVSNREPLLPNPLVKLPVGSVQPEGWLRQQLNLMADGFSGHLTEISKWCKIEGSAWVNPHGEGENGWEEMPVLVEGLRRPGICITRQSNHCGSEQVD